MATIIDKTMEKAFPGEYRNRDSLMQDVRVYFERLWRSFYDKVGFPVVKLPEESPVKETKPDNLWIRQNVN